MACRLFRAFSCADMSKDMSLPLVDLSKIKIHPQAAAWLKGQAQAQHKDVASYVRDVIHAHVKQGIHAYSLAEAEIKAKGFAGIDGDF
jgi:hypothetical protein